LSHDFIEGAKMKRFNGVIGASLSASCLGLSAIAHAEQATSADNVRDDITVAGIKSVDRAMASKADIPTLEKAQAISIVSQQTLIDRGVIRANVATADAVLPYVYVLTGEQRRRGVEAEIAWRPGNGVQLTAAYTYLDAKVTADNRLLVGTRLGSVPRHIVDLWARYKVPSGPLANLGAAAGLHHESNRAASTASALAGARQPFMLDGYVLVDGTMFYRFDDWSIQANIRNIFNERDFPTASLTRTTPCEPRTFMASLQRHF